MRYLHTIYKTVLCLVYCLLLGVFALSAQEMNCMDGLDNDGDGLTDCFDLECPSCDFDCEYKVPSSGSGDVTLMTANTGTDPDYVEVFVVIDEAGVIQYMTLDTPPTFTGVVPGEYLAMVLVYQSDAGIANLAIGNNINIVSSGCIAMSDSYPFEVCLNQPPTITTIESNPLCYCAGEAIVSETITAADPDMDSLKATVHISGGYIVGEDILSYTGTIAVPTMFDAATGMLMIGPAPPSVIDFALNNVVYQNTSAIGAETVGSRIIDYSLTDGLDTAGPISREVQVGNTACPCQEILAAKEVSSVNTMVCDGTDNIHVTYSLVFGNTGSMDLGNISLTENLASQLGAAFVSVVSAPTIVFSNATTDPIINGGYDGAASTDLFDAMSGVLKPGERMVMEVVVEINNDLISSTLNNQATITGTAIDDFGNPILDGVGAPVITSDLTDNGTDPRTDNGMGGTDDVTPLQFPAIGVTKAVTSAVQTIGAGTEEYTVSYELIVENTGTTILEDFTLIDDLSTWGAALLTNPAATVSLMNVDATALPIDNDGNFNGTSDNNLIAAGGSGLLNPGESFKVIVTVPVDKSAAPLTGLANSAMTEAVPTDGAGNPIAGLNNPVDTSDDATGLAAGDPACKNPGAHNDSGGADDPTIVTFPPCPVLTKTIPSTPVELPNGNFAVTYNFVIENVGGAEMCNIDLTEDFADELGCAFQDIISTSTINLANTSGNSTSPTANIAYDGATNDNLFNTDGCLFPGDVIDLAVTVELDVTCDGIDDPLLNTATVCGTDPNTGMKVSDDSDSTTNGGPDDPTPLSIPNIDLTKDQISSTMLANGNIEVEYQLTIQNTGNTNLLNVALEDDLATQLSPAFVSAMTVSITGDATILGNLNTGFTGAGTTSSSTTDGDDLIDRSAVMQPGEMIVVIIKAEIDPLAVPSTGLTNQATTNAVDPDGTAVSDISDDDVGPGEDDPTPLDLGPIPELEKTLTAAPVALPNGNFELTYEFNLKNNGTEEMCQIDVLDDIDTQFACAFVSANPATLVAFNNNTGNSIQPTFNTAFNGSSFTNMFNGNGCIHPTDSIQWTIVVEVTSDCDPLNSPLANIATVNAEDPDGNGLTDLSDDDTDLDSDTTPDNESGGEDDPTFAYLPNIEITKNLVGQTVLADGNVELEFEFIVENTGNANLSNLLVEDPLVFSSALIGTPVVSLTNITASSPPSDNNGNFNGTSNDDLTVASATDLLQPSESFQMNMTAVVDPEIFGLLSPQPVENQATVVGDPVDTNGNPIPGYGPIMDESDDSAEVEPGPDDPTPITIPPIPELTKGITATPIELANGNYSVNYEFIIKNKGGSRFCQIDLLEDFATQYGCAFVDILATTNPVLTNVSGNSIIPTSNALYNGTSQINLLNTDGCLYPGDSISITTTIELDPSCMPIDDPLVNQATVNGVDDEDNPVTDDSDDESEFPNETGGPDDPTLLSIPDIDLAKTQTSSTMLPNGNMEVIFQMVIQNTGNTDLTNVALEDDLATQFSPAFVSAMTVAINGTASTLGGFNTGFIGGGITNSATVDGDDILDRTAILKPGEVIVVDIKVEIDPLQVPSTGLSNQATTMGTDPNGDPVTDISDDGTDPTDDTDVPTPLDFGPIPELEKALVGLPVKLANGNYALTYEYNLKNNGTSEFCQIDVVDDFNTQFGCAFVNANTPTPIAFANNSGSSIQPSLNTGFNGNSLVNMYTGDGCIFPGDSIQWSLTVEVTLDCEPVPSPLANTATVNAQDPDGDPVTDDSDDETDLDADDDPDNDTGGEDDPTLAYLPEIEITKELIGSTSLSNGNVSLEFKFNIENTGNANLSTINVTDPLPFATAVVGTPILTLMNTSATMPPMDNNGSFNGGSNINMTLGAATDMLRPAESFMVMLEVEVDPVIFGQLPMPLLNQAMATGNPVDNNGDPIPGYPSVDDVSDDVSELPGDDDPTPVTIPPTPKLKKSTVGIPTELSNGNYSVVYNFKIKNLGGSEFCQIDLLEDFATQYGCAFVDILATTPPVLDNLTGNSTNPSLNTLYNGSSQANLLNTDGCLFPGDSITMTVTAEIDPTCMPVDEPLMNTATVNGVAPDGDPVTDDSDDESDIPNDTGGPDDPTLLSIPNIDVSKEQLGHTNLPNGNIEVEYQLIIQNTGNTILNNVALEDDIATQFSPAFVSATSVSVNGTANTIGGLNTGFNGGGLTSSPAIDGDDILDRTGVMNPGENIVVVIKVEVDPLLVPTAGLSNQATATGNDPSGNPVDDISDNGVDPTGDTDTPTPLDLGPIPEIIKTLVAAPTQLANGNYTMDFSFVMKNDGTSEMCQIDVLEDLDTQYGCAFVDADPATLVSFGNVSGNSIMPSINTGYNGNSDFNMFTGNGCIFPGDSLEWTISVEVTIDCEPIPSPLANTATVNAEDPDGNPVTDDSDDDTDLDNDDDPDNETGDDDDPTFTYFPEISITKDLVAVTELPNGNFNMEFAFDIENTGNANLSTINVTDPLPFASAVVGTPVLTLTNVSGTIPPLDNNGSFDGSGDINMTIGAATDLLQPNESFMMIMEVEVDPMIFGTLPMPVLNQATAMGTPIDKNGDPIPGYPPVEDESDDDSDLPGDDDPTPVSIPPVPQLNKAISGSPTALPNGNYAVTYNFIIENIGGSEFCKIDLIEDFATQYDCAFVGMLGTGDPTLVNSSGNSTNPTLNSLYNGAAQTNLLNTDGCLFPGDLISIIVTVEVDISCPTRPEPLANQATVMGEGPNGEVVEDDSDDDTDLNGDNNPDNETGGPDDPTILPIPEINITKAVTGGRELPNGNYEINFEFIVENTGNVDLNNLSLVDPLTFGSTLTAMPTASLVNISASNPPVVNTAYDGITTTDLLAGMATDLLAPGQQFKVLLTTEVDFAAFAALMQPVENQATAAADDPDGNTVEDESDDESEVKNETGGPDDPTLIPVPQIKITKDVVDIQPALTEGNYYVTFELVVKNTGNVDLDSIQVSDDLAAEFGSAYVGMTAGPIVSTSNGTPSTPNAGTFPINVFDGTSGLLKPQDELTIEFTVEVNPDAGGAPTPLANQATATGKGLDGNEVTDISDDSADPDDPDMDDPTPLYLPQINLAKEITEVVPAASGIANHFDVNYRFVIQNTGNVPLDSLTLVDDLATDLGVAFVEVVALPSVYTPLTTATTTPTINPMFIGTAPALDMFLGMPTDMLLPGETLAVEVTVELNPSAAGADSPLMNQATASGKDPNDTVTEDDSDNGADPDGTNGEGGPNDPTPLDCKPARMAITPDAITICAGEDVSLNVTSDIAGASYKWENLNQSGVIASTDQNPTFTDIPVTTDFALTICPTDGACWTGLTDTITITVIPTATAPVVANIEICEGDLIQLTTTRVGVDSYNWTGPNGFSSTDQNPFVTNSATATDAGTYQLTTRVDDCPSDPAFATVIVDEIPDTPTLQTNGPICEGDSIVLSTSAICDSYQWIGPDGSSTNTLSNPLLTTMVNSTSIPPADSAYDAGLWTVICINGNGCASAPSAAVEQVINTVPARPTPNYSGAVCEGNAITLLTGGAYEASVTYAWYTVDPEIDLTAIPFSTTAEPIINDLSAGAYDYWLVVSNNNCTSSSASVKVTINKLPIVTAENDGTECVTPMTDINLRATPDGGITPYQYQWTGPNGFNAIEQAVVLPNATNDLSGNYLLVLTDANGCTAEALTSIDITVGPDEPFLDGNGPLCFGESFFLSATPSYTGSDIHYEWSGPRGTTTGGAYPDSPILMIDTTSTADVGTYNLQVIKDGCASVISQPYELILITPPNAPIVEDVAVCLGDLLQIATETSAESYVWTGPNGFSSTDQNPFVSSNASITDVGPYEVRIVQGNCISEAAMVNVTINSLEEPPTLQTNAPICEGDNLVLQTSATCDMYIWIGPDGSSTTTLSNPLLVTTINTTTIPVGDIAYDEGIWTLICQNGDGCNSAASAPVEVVINSIPDAPLPKNNGPVCLGEEMILSAGADYPEGTTFQWYSSNPATGGIIISNEQNPSFSNFTTPGNFFYWLTVTTNSCTSPAGITLAVIRELPTVTASNNGTECVNPTTDLIISSVPAGGTAPYTFSWTGPNDFASIEQNPILPNAGDDLTGSYIVVITDANGCTATAETTIDVSENPSRPNLVYSGVTCEGQSTTLNIQEFAGVEVNYNWFKDGIAIANIGNQLILNPISITDKGDYHVLVEVDGCSTISDTLLVEVYEQPTANIAMVTNQDCVVGLEELMLIALPEGGSGNYRYTWSGPNGFVSTDSIATLINIDANTSGTYTLEVTDDNACIAAITSQTVDVTNGIVEPTINISDLSCEGGEVKLSVLAYSGSNVTYTWSTPTTINVTGLNTNEIIVSPMDSTIHQGNYSVTVEVDDCIIQSDTFLLQTLPAPTVAPTYILGGLCTGGNLELFANATDAVQYNWAGPAGFVSSLPNPTISSVSVANNGQYAVTVTNSSGCSAVGFVMITDILESNSTASIVSNSPICNGEDLVLSSSTEGVLYEWIGPLGASDQTLSTVVGLRTSDNTTTLSPSSIAYKEGTYSLRVTDANGCTSVSEEIEIVINEIPATPLPTNDGPVCIGSEVQLSAGANYPAETIYNWYAADPSTIGSTIFSNDENPIINNITIAGTYTYWLTIDIAGCISPAGQTTVVVNEQPSVTANNTGTECVDPMTDLGLLATPSGGVAPYNYLWTGPSGFNSIDQNPTLPNAGGILTGTYIVQITDANGCTATAETVIDVTGNPNRPNLQYTGSVCEGERIELSIQEFAGVAVSYNWFKDGVAITNISNQLILNPATTEDNGNYSVQVQVDGCTTMSDTLLLEVYEEPTVSISTIVAQACVAGQGELNLIAFPSGGVGPYKYEWSGPNNFISADSVATIVNITSAATGIYTLIVTDANACVSVLATQELDVTDDFLEPQININNVACAGEEIILEVPSYEGNSVNYTWSTPNNVTANITGLNTNTIIINPVDRSIHQGNYSVLIDIDGCVIASDTFNLETLIAPTVDPIILTQELCTGEILSLSANATNAVSYDWSGPADFNSDLPDPSLIDVTIANNGQYGVTVTNSSGCTAVGFVEVNVINPPRETPSFITNSPICEGEDLILSSSSEGVTFEWIGSLGGSDQTLITYPNLVTSEGNTIIDSNNPAYLAGEWTVRVIDTNGCTISSEPIEVVINPIPRALAFNDGPICQGEGIGLTAGEEENAVYEWRVVGDSEIISTSRTPVFDNIQTTTLYELTVIAEGCIGQRDTTEVIIWEPPILTPSTTYDLNDDCAASDVQLIANAIEGSGAVVSYNWTGPNNFTSTLANPTIPSAGELVNGTYTLEVVDENGCMASAATEILNVADNQNAPFIIPSGPSCEGGKITLSIPAYSGSNIVYTWYKNTIAISNINSPTLIFDPVSLEDEANYFVSIVVDGCTITSAPYSLEIYESPVVRIAPIAPLSCVTGSEEVNFNATVVGGLAPYQYEWSGPNDFSAFTEDPSLINIDASKSGIYTLNVVDANGCSALTTSVNVDITQGNHEPIITASAPTCEGGSVTLSTKDEWGSAVDFQWTKDGQILGDIHTNTFTIFPVTAADAGAYRVQITLDGCTNISDVYNLEIYTAPTLTISNNGMECVEAMDDLQLFATPNSNPAGLTYEWTGPNGFASNAQNPFLPNATDAQSGDYTVVVRNINGCENSYSTTVDISRIPDKPTISAEGDICSGTLLKLNAPIYNGIEVDYEWIGPFGSTTSGAYPNSPSLTISPATTVFNGLYTLSVTINGCSSLLSEAYVVNIDAPPVVQITSGSINCAAPNSTLTLNTSVTGGVGPYQFEWTGPNGFTSTAGSPVLANLSNEDAGTYTVLVTDASGCQAQVASQFIAISTPPATPEVQLVTPNVCEGETVILSANNYTGASVTYYWSIQGTSTMLDTTTSPSLILQNISADYTGIVSVRVIVDGCVSSVSAAKELIVSPQPSAPELTASFVVCEGDNLQLSTSTIADSYRWTGPNGFVATDQFPTIINNISTQEAGLYTLVSIENGCESEPSYTNVVLNSRLTQPTLQVVSDICDGDLLVMQVQTPLQDVTYQWIPPSMNVGQFPEDRASFTEPVLWTDQPFLAISKIDHFHLYESGDWRVRVVNSTGCTSETSLSKLINIHEIPELPLMTNTGPICQGEAVQLMASPLPGVTYSWYREIILGDGSATYELVSNNQQYETSDLRMGSNMFFLTVDRNGCSMSSLPGQDGGVEVEGMYTEIIVNEMPIVTLPEITGNYCEGDIVQLDAPSIPGATYAWTGPNDFVSFVEDPTVFNMTTASSGVYTLVVSREGCEAAPVSTQVLIASQPMTPTISHDGNACEGEEIRLMVSNIANGNFIRYEWTGPDGFFVATQDLIIPSAAKSDEGDYTVKVYVNGCGSLTSAPVTVVVNSIPAAPSIAASGSVEAPLCEGEPILLETNYDPLLTYRWVGPAGFSSNIHNPIINNTRMLNAGTYSLSVVSDGCASAVSSIEVGIQGSPSQPFAANTGPVCSGDDLRLYITNPVQGNTYEWFKQQGNEFVGSGESLTLSGVDIRDAGSYYVLASVGDCTSDAYTGEGIVEQVFTTVEIENSTKELAHTTGTLFACEEEVNLTATTPQSTSGFWTAIDTDARIIDPNHPKSLVTNLQSGTNTFVWSLLTDNCGIPSSDTLRVSHNVIPVATEDFYNTGMNEIQDINLIENDFLQSTDATITILTDLQLGRAIPNDLGEYTYVPNENAVGVETFTYQICQKECPDLCAEAIATIVVGEDVNCFAGEFVTPNNDGFNDTFIAPCLANYSNSSLTIYNRYGDEIYFSDNYQNDWEGTYNGAILPAGTYYYILRVNDPAGTTLSGYIFLQR